MILLAVLVGVAAAQDAPPPSSLALLFEQLRPPETVCGEVAVTIRTECGSASTACDVLAARLGAHLANGLRQQSCVRLSDVVPSRSSWHDIGAAARWATVHGYDWTYDLRLEISERAAVLAGPLYQAQRRGWAAAFDPGILERRRVSVRVPIDAELQHLLAGPSIVTNESIQVDRFSLPSRGYVALAVGDVGGTPLPELVLIGGNHVQAVYAHFHPSASITATLDPVSLSSLPRSSAPPTRAIGTAVVLERSVTARTSELATSVRVHIEDDTLHVTSTNEPCGVDRYAMADGCIAPVVGRDSFTPAVVGWDGQPRSPAPSGFYSRAFAWIRQPDGSAQRTEAVVSPRGRLVVRVGDRDAGLTDVGAALAMTDLDLDGTVELLVSDNALVGAGDHLRVLRVRPNNTIVEVWTSDALTGSVFLAAAGDIDGDGRQELLAVEEPTDPDEPATLWVIR